MPCMTLNDISYSAGVMFREWSNYWLRVEDRVPPIHVWQVLPSGVGFVVPCTAREIDRFLEGSAMRELHYQRFGFSMLNEERWIGNWAVLSATPRHHTNQKRKASNDVP
jgi:hypothetical protein